MSAQTNYYESRNPPVLSPDLFRRLLVCTDFSEASNAALRAAVTLSKANRASLTILHVNATGSLPEVPKQGNEFVMAVRRKIEKSLAAAVNAARVAGVEAVSVMREGSVREVVLQELEARQADLAVIGTHGARGLERMLFGSTAEAIFRSATCPVMTVGPALSRAASTMTEGPIVFATDFDEQGTEAAQWATKLANLHRVPLHCIHVLPQCMGDAGSTNTLLASVMTKALQELMFEKDQLGAKAVFKVIFGNEVSHSVVDYARSCGARAIVLGATRKMPFEGHLPPHIVYKIIVGAPCPVVTLGYDRKV